MPPLKKVHPTHNVNTNIYINFLTAIDAEASADKKCTALYYFYYYEIENHSWICWKLIFVWL